MSQSFLLPCLVLFLLPCAVQDYRARRVSNWLTLPRLLRRLAPGPCSGRGGTHLLHLRGLCRLLAGLGNEEHGGR